MGFSHFLYDYVLVYLPRFCIYITILSFLFLAVYRLLFVQKLEFIIQWERLAGVVFSTATVLLLYDYGLIRNLYFSNFIITTFVFYTVVLFIHRFFRFNTIYEKSYCKNITKSDGAGFFTTCIFFLYILILLINIKVFGINNHNKLGSGTGIIVRIQNTLGIIINYSIIYSIFYSKKKKKYILFFLLIVLVTFTGGSKSSVLKCFLTFFTFVMLNPKKIEARTFILKYGFLLIFVSIISALIMISLLTKIHFSIKETIASLFYRFVAYGDIYPYAYVEEVGDKVVEEVSLSHYIFGELLSTYRLADRSYSDALNLSGKVVEFVAGPGIAEGPNQRFNCAGLFFFGYGGSILFSILCAVIYSFAHYCFLKAVNNSFYKQIFLLYLYSSLIAVEQDSTIIGRFITNLIFFLIIIGVLYILQSSVSRNNRYKKMLIFYICKFRKNEKKY